MAESLHDLSPGLGIVAPSAVAIELLIVLNEGFTENTLPRPFSGSGVESPNGGYVDLDVFADYVELVEHVDDLEGFIDSFDIEGEVVGLEDGTSLEPLDDACLALTSA